MRIHLFTMFKYEKWHFMSAYVITRMSMIIKVRVHEY